MQFLKNRMNKMEERPQYVDSRAISVERYVKLEDHKTIMIVVEHHKTKNSNVEIRKHEVPMNFKSC